MSDSLRALRADLPRQKVGKPGFRRIFATHSISTKKIGFIFQTKSVRLFLHAEPPALNDRHGKPSTFFFAKEVQNAAKIPDNTKAKP
jgi:hypothetical protein